MPEVYAPSPQRVMPEVPQNMQQDLQRLELESVSDTRSNSSAAPGLRHDLILLEQELNRQNRDPAERARDRAEAYQPSDFKPFSATEGATASLDMPSFSPFPRVKGENIPPNDEEKEEILMAARSLVLHSNNVSMQVSWARDVLMWVEVAADAATREWIRDSKGKNIARPQTPAPEHMLRNDAAGIIGFLADQGHPEATFMRAKWQEFGKFGYRENKKEAYVGYKKAAEMGWSRAEYRMGMLYENSNDIEKAIQHYSRGVAANDSAANYRMGMMNLLGQHGYPKNFQRGVDLIQVAADSADEDAPQGAYVYGMLIARELPDIYLPETVLPTDDAAARQYIEKAAYLGFAKAQLKMGQVYELSQLSCDFNPLYSLHYYGLAARQGQPEASLGVSRWFLFGQEGFFQKNEPLAYRFAQDAADVGLATGEFAMGYYHEIGIHVRKDLVKAREWYTLAAEHGNVEARGRLEALKDQSRALTKSDHDTTTLKRIKSQHGSQRGKRPERFRQPDQMPTLDEFSAADAVVGALDSSSHTHALDTLTSDSFGFPDPARHSFIEQRQLGYAGSLDNVSIRPKSAAPYPEDDIRVLRSRSTAPYPEDDVSRPLISPHLNPDGRSSSGPRPDRPISSIGARPLSSNGQVGPGHGGLRPSTSAGNIPPGSFQPSRGRLFQGTGSGWDPQVPTGTQPQAPNLARKEVPYRQGAPQHVAQQAQSYSQGPPQRAGATSAGLGLSSASAVSSFVDPTRNRLTKTNPNKPQPLAQGPPTGQYPTGAYSTSATGHYGPRSSSRPASDGYDRYGSVPPGPSSNGGGRAPSVGVDRAPRTDSLIMSGAGGNGLRPSVPLNAAQMHGMPGRASAPPVRPASAATTSSPAPSAASAPQTRHASGATINGTTHPDGKSIGQGPSTFEEMGIPQGKNDSDCIVM